MTKRVFIIHGWEGSPKEPMLKHLAEKLTENKFEVHSLDMPNPDEPQIEQWVSHLSKNVGKVDENTYFIGHSIGCQTVLRYLQTLNLGVIIGGIILIAPWTHLKNIEEEEGAEEVAKPWLETPIDFQAIKTHTKNITAIFSENDYYVPTSELDLFKEKLNAKVISSGEKGHFKEEDGVLELPEVLSAIKDMS